MTIEIANVYFERHEDDKSPGWIWIVKSPCGFRVSMREQGGGDRIVDAQATREHMVELRDALNRELGA